MLEDTVITEFRLKPIDPEMVVSIKNGETAYSLEVINHGKALTQKEEEEILSRILITGSTLGFESDTECDFSPSDLTTYNADKSENANYSYGNHAPGEEDYQVERCFKPGEKVLCLMYEEYNAVFPGTVVGPLTEEYLRQLYETDEEMRIVYSSADEVVEKWNDCNWDSVIIRPLVRLKNEWEEMGDIVIVNRVYVFPFLKYKV